MTSRSDHPGTAGTNGESESSSDPETPDGEVHPEVSEAEEDAEAAETPGSPSDSGDADWDSPANGKDSDDGGDAAGDSEDSALADSVPQLPVVIPQPVAGGGGDAPRESDTAARHFTASTEYGNALRVQAALIGVHIDDQTIREIGDDRRDLRYLVQEAGLEVTNLRIGSRLKRVPLPVALCIDEGSEGKGDRWVVLYAIQDDEAVLADPELPGSFSKAPLADIQSTFTGHAVTVRKSLDKTAVDQQALHGKRHWFWSRVASRNIPTGKIIIASLVANVLAVAASFFALQVYDRVIPNQSEETLYVLLIGVLCALVLEALLRVARSHVMDRAGRTVDVTASSDLLRRLTMLKLTPEVPRPSRLAQLMREFSSLREFITEAAVGALADIPFSIMFLGIIYWIAGPVVIIPATAMVLMILPPILYRKRMLRIAEEALGSHTAAGRVFNEVAYGLETVKVNRAETFFTDQWKEISRLIAASSAKQRRLSAKLTQSATSIQQIAHALTVTAAALQVFVGNMTIGGIIATTLLMGRCLSPMTRFSTVLMRWHQVKTSLDGLDTIANAESDVPSEQPKLPRGRRPGTLVAENVNFLYSKDDNPVIDVQHLRIGRGERVAILGPNGSGKSTLLRCLSGLFTPSAGRVTLDGIDLRQIDPRDLRRAVGYLPQDTVLFNGTLRDNLTFRRQDIDDQWLLSALERAGLGEFVRNHPSGLDMRLSDASSGLSVGQRQSVGLARLIVNDPGTVLLDEPTASFDPNVEAAAIQHLERWLAKRTFLVATHRTPILNLVDRVLVIGQGRIMLDGPRNEVMEKITNFQTAMRKAAAKKAGASGPQPPSSPAARLQAS